METQQIDSDSDEFTLEIAEAFARDRTVVVDGTKVQRLPEDNPNRFALIFDDGPELRGFDHTESIMAAASRFR